MAKQTNWELIDGNPPAGISRLRVPGGWLICVLTNEFGASAAETDQRFPAAAGVTFYPDPMHAWDDKSRS